MVEVPTNMPESEEDFKAFIREIAAGLYLIQDEAAQSQPGPQRLRREDLPSAQSAVRAIAEDLMLCRNVREAIISRKEDRAMLLSLVAMTNLMPPDIFALAHHLAYKAVRDEDWRAFPGIPLANFLLVLSRFELFNSSFHRPFRLLFHIKTQESTYKMGFVGFLYAFPATIYGDTTKHFGIIYFANAESFTVQNRLFRKVVVKAVVLRIDCSRKLKNGQSFGAPL